VTEPQGDSSPPVWVIEPSFQTLEFGEHLSLQLAAWDASGIGSWSVNDTSRFEISAAGKLTTTQLLSIGLYGLNVTVADIFGNSISFDFQVSVVDATSPVWLAFPSDRWLDEGESLEYPIEASDRSGIDHWWLNDTTHFEIDEQGVIRNATVLGSGIYGLEVRAYDLSGNYCSARLVLTVNEMPTASTTTATEPALSVGAFVVAGVAGCAGLVVLSFLVGRKMGKRSSG
jgi:hypothetical protein